MKTIMYRRVVRLGVMVGGLLAVAGVMAYAIPVTGGVIYACLSKDGSLRVIDPSAGGQCTLGETPIQWNQTGPQGPQGPQGSQGPPGPQGPRGPSDAYVTNNGLNPQNFSNGNEVTVATLNLPAGNYVFNAKVLVGNRSSSSNEQVNCTLRYGASGAGLIDIADMRLFGGAPSTAGSYTTLPLAGSIILPSSETIKVICVTTSSDAFAQYAQLNAVAVARLNPQ